MKSKLVEHITLKVGAIKDYVHFAKVDKQDYEWLKIKKELLHIEKHLVWLNDIVNKHIKS